MNLENIVKDIYKSYVTRRYKEIFNFAIKTLEMDIKIQQNF